MFEQPEISLFWKKKKYDLFKIHDMLLLLLFFGSNAERVREFIKNVYVQKKYAGANDADKPTKDSQARLFCFFYAIFLNLTHILLQFLG